MTKELDNCEICLGAKGGVKGNENIVDHVVMCDYCSVEYQNAKKKYDASRKKRQLLHLFSLLFIAISMWIISSFATFVYLSSKAAKDFQKVIDVQSERDHQRRLAEMKFNAIQAYPKATEMHYCFNVKSGNFLIAFDGNGDIQGVDVSIK